MNQKKLKSFLGTGWSFPPVFDENSKGLKMVSDEEDIRQSLVVLLSTTPGERVTNPNFGCDLRQILFEPISSATEFLIKDTIALSVLYYEPRIDLDDVEIDVSRENEGMLNLTLHYTIRQTNSRSNIVFPFYKVEGTNVTQAYVQ